MKTESCCWRGRLRGLRWSKGCKKVSGTFRLAAALLTAALLLLRSEVAGEGVREGIALSAETVIPSLFPFMVLCGMLSGGGLRIPFLTRILGLPEEAAGAVLLGLTGGYPAGARAVSDLTRRGKILPEAGETALCTGYLAGPAFMAGMGRYLFGNGKIGLILWLCQLLAALLTGAFCGWIFSRFGGVSAPCSDAENGRPPEPFSVRFVESVLSGVKGMGTVCGFVVVFAVIRRYFCLFPAGKMLVPFLEVSVGCIQAKGMAFLPAVLTVCMSCSLGGVSVWMQNFCFLRGSGVGMRRFFISRMVHLPLSCALTAAAVQLLHLSGWVREEAALAVFAPGTVFRPAEGNSLASVFLIISCMILLIGERKVCYNKSYEA